ncbi:MULTISPECIES: TetR/AcrR family transcriptional regulator [Brevibacterium]|uniref:TetR family transcriptional regulator C-terminal domain-containing protein n=1 Tax=Brevibacterium salitolerans TaxID=1403566 RepID=A0ABN2WDW9_9MICO|nr:TetR/AcrR family transcriptional regulator [Brevibacterium sp.]
MPKIVDHDQRRTEIVHALWEVISERGIEGVTFQAVARSAGFSVGRVQHYFASKDALVRAGCRELIDASAAVHAERTSRSQSPWEALAQLLMQPIPRSEELRLGAAVWYAYMARGVVDPAIGEIAREATHRGLEEASALLRRAGADESAAPRLMGLSAGLAQQVLLRAVQAEEALGLVREEIAALREG